VLIERDCFQNCILSDRRHLTPRLPGARR
jgi:hypothetical protein